MRVNESFLGAVAWSHDGKRIAFGGRNLWIMNSITFSFLSMVVLDSIEMDKVIGNFGMLTVMVIVPLISSGLISFVILQNRKWIYYTLELTLFVGLFLVFSCFYCIG